MRVAASSKGSGCSIATETDGENATEVSNGALSEEYIYKGRRRKEGGEIIGRTIVTQSKKKKKRKEGKGSEKKKQRKHTEQATAKHSQNRTLQRQCINIFTRSRYAIKSLRIK